ncbi:hypothetical protein, partial [Streptomyces shenzhenensis]|uniref:hypothetical protein n=1 Tax=Streptomyces shenzhenensis TaxID=943815 RepID=UPI001C68A3C7
RLSRAARARARADTDVPPPFPAESESVEQPTSTAAEATETIRLLLRNSEGNDTADVLRGLVRTHGRACTPP